MLYGIMNVGFDLCWMQLVIAYAPAAEIGIYGSVYTFLMGVRGILAMMFANLSLSFLGPDNLLIIAGVVYGFGPGNRRSETRSLEGIIYAFL